MYLQSEILVVPWWAAQVVGPGGGPEALHCSGRGESVVEEPQPGARWGGSLGSYHSPPPGHAQNGSSICGLERDESAWGTLRWRDSYLTNLTHTFINLPYVSQTGVELRSRPVILVLIWEDTIWSLWWKRERSEEFSSFQFGGVLLY